MEVGGRGGRERGMEVQEEGEDEEEIRRCERKCSPLSAGSS